MKTVHVTQARKQMATQFELTISCASEHSNRADRLLDRCHQEIARLEDELSEFRSTSSVYLINASRIQKKIICPRSVIELLELGGRISSETQGSFNYLAKSGEGLQGGIAWDRQTLEVWRTDERAHLGFGAIGKGYALDRARLLLEQEGFHDYLLVAGGSSIVISGFAAPGEPWTWGWSWKRDSRGEAEGIPFAHAYGSPIAIGVSGTQEQGAHLIDPTTGKATQNELRSALVASHSAARADALSTALFVGGWENTHASVSESTATYALAAIDADERPRWNGIFQRLWGEISTLGLVLLTLATLTATVPALAQDNAVVAAPEQNQDSSEEVVDLGGAPESPWSNFTPYLFSRDNIWIALPVFAAVVILIHLKKHRRSRKTLMDRSVSDS